MSMGSLVRSVCYVLNLGIQEDCFLRPLPRGHRQAGPWRRQVAGVAGSLVLQGGSEEANPHSPRQRASTTPTGPLVMLPNGTSCRDSLEVCRPEYSSWVGNPITSNNDMQQLAQITPVLTT